MKKSQRWLVVASLLLLSVASAVYCLDYRAYGFYSYEGRVFDRSFKPPPAPVINFGQMRQGLSDAQIFGAAPATMDEFLAQHRVMVSGMYPRTGMTFEEAVMGGLLVPFLLIVAACYLALGGPRTDGKNGATASAATYLPPRIHGPSPVAALALEPIPTCAPPNIREKDEPDVTPKEIAPPATAAVREPLRKMAVVVALLFPVLFVLDMPSIMLANRLRFPRWLFAVFTLYALGQVAPHR